ncbi:DcaP family trimeric outer membrane transporter [Paraglaciecola marina]|uniref:DcaP family trimeric outer membrane transporter n=1 Tax=Paraglaciecola marina TaxID=2500157 RepID=UPI00105C50FD|nr:DcaP family trimeric outer membrane transporter [Paraglaciecola marina]
MKHTIFNRLLGLSIASTLLTQSTYAVELLNITDGDETTIVSLGGYAKIDVRHVNGDVGYQDYWAANLPGGEAIETSHTGFNIRESRINFKITHGEVTGFVEFDLYGAGGNEVISNSSNPRVRHFFINYKNWMLGQTWSTFMPLQALPEALDFGGPHVGEVFVRQTQVRYTSGNWQFAIENPETNGDGDIGTPSSAVGLSGTEADPDEAIPDFVARYNHSADWGQLSFGALVRKIDQGGLDETGIALNLAGKINTYGKDDLRFQVTVGEPGRYAAAAMTSDIVTNPDTAETEVEGTTAFTVAYRHFWTETLRSTAFYGAAETEVLKLKRSHWGVNVIDSVTNKLDIGGELGSFAVDDDGITAIDSTYLQFSATYKF